ncbi:hypothetical protein [Cognatitamlana onchidii]|uniref:hypothetical protein n=1 Tax=Cognatitamlana onchidii TaxID=2562860 RepID=UPI001F29E35D|nr:hypothetical protein [Algibacter onchidii]
MAVGWLNSELKKTVPQLKIRLTDFYPNISAFTYLSDSCDNISYEEQPVNAMHVPDDLKGLRTQFLSLHHFKPNDAIKILQSAVNSKSGIAVFEAQERSVPSILAMVFSPLSVLFTTPFIKPFKLGRVLFTYLIPIVPLFVFWDGVVSSLRTYSVKEMKSLVDGLDNKDTFNWKIDKINTKPGVILYLVGTPKTS